MHSVSLQILFRQNCNASLALALYGRAVLSSGNAAALAGMTRWQWEELLGARKIPRHYTEEDLCIDSAYGSCGQ